MQPAAGAYPYATQIKVGLSTSLASALLFLIIGSIAASIQQPGGVLVYAGVLFPLCSWYGVRNKGKNALAAFCCCTGLLVLLFVVGCITQIQIEKPRLACVCDITCTTLPQAGGGRGQGGEVTDPSVLRNTTLYSSLCASKDAVYSGMTAYVVLGVLGMIAQLIACTTLCWVRGKWNAEGSPNLFTTPVEVVSPAMPRGYLYNPHAASPMYNHVASPPPANGASATLASSASQPAGER